MSRERRRRSESQMPATSAGLLRFFEEETPGIKMRPEMVIVIAAALIALSLISVFIAR